MGSISVGSSFLRPWWVPCLMTMALVAAGVLAFTPSASEWFNSTKSFEITLQFLFVAVLGGGVAVFYREMESRRAQGVRDQEKMRERMEAQRIALEEFRKDLIETYHSAKKIRRTLRAASFPIDDDNYGCMRETFERLMDQMEEVQLKIEALKSEVDARKDLFGTASEKDNLSNILKTSNAYLRDLLRFYEDGYIEKFLDDENPPVRLSLSLMDFIGRSGQGEKVTKRFYEPMDEARRRIVRLIEQNVPTGQDEAPPAT